jgi:hypothetical protein
MMDTSWRYSMATVAAKMAHHSASHSSCSVTWRLAARASPPPGSAAATPGGVRGAGGLWRR